jgi:Holliday junction resolvasome RuvABC endonuclease subunit
MHVSVGLDLSLNSPGVAVEQKGCIHLCGFQQRKTDPEILSAPLGKLRITRLKYPEGPRWTRCCYVADAIVAWIRGFVGEGDTVHVYIEGYAFSMAGSASMSKLAEVGGVLRYLFMKQGWAFSEIPPSRIKKHFTGDGRAKKAAMLQAYTDKHGLPLMNDVLKIKSHQHPQEDMIDALAILRTGVHFREEENQGRVKRKGKPVKPDKKGKKRLRFK